MNKKAVFSVILSGILWGIISLFINALSSAGFDSMQIACIRMITSAAMMTIFVAIRSPEKLKIKLKDIWMFIGTGIVSVVLFNTCYFYTMINSQASVAVVLLYTSPVFIMIMSAILFKEKITGKKIIALLLTFTGCVFVAGIVGGGYRITPFILLTGLGSGLFYALYTIFGRFALKKYDTFTVTAYTFIFGMLGSIPTGKLSRTAEIIRFNPKIVLFCIGIGLVSTVLPYVLYTWGLQRMESGKAAILVAVEPLVGALIGMTVYNEPHNILKLIGIGMILCSIILLSTGERNVKKDENIPKNVLKSVDKQGII
ncbi:MAG: DMT family transporter [Clostridia bacterium]|nr:DMT family transporter [Clostridia bacterium]